MKRVFATGLFLCLLATYHVFAKSTNSASAVLEKEVSGIRGLSFRKPVVYRKISTNDFAAFVQKKVRDVYTPEEIIDYSRSLQVLGLLPEGYDLEKAYVNLLNEQVAAFYDQKDHVLYTFSDVSTQGSTERLILAHELTHALQDQNFDISKMPLETKNNDDLVLATSALLEGDANLVMSRIALQGMKLEDVLQALEHELGKNSEHILKSPLYLRETLLFPYMEGQAFAQWLHAKGGNRALNAAYKRMPGGTMHILHPELFYPRYTKIVEVQLPDWSPEGGYLLDTNTLGEYCLSIYFQAHGIGYFDSKQAAAGWRGDRYKVWLDQNRQPVVLWKLVFSEPKEASEALDFWKKAFSRNASTTDYSETQNEMKLTLPNQQIFTVKLEKDSLWMTQHSKGTKMPVMK